MWSSFEAGPNVIRRSCLEGDKMNGKWHVHFGNAQIPKVSDDLVSKEAALAQARTLKGNPLGPVFRYISGPDSMIMPEPQVVTWCAKNPV